MLTFIIWQLKGAGVCGGSIYGVTGEAKQAPGLPTVPKGHWERVRLVNEDRYWVLPPIEILEVNKAAGTCRDVTREFMAEVEERAPA